MRYVSLSLPLAEKNAKKREYQKLHQHLSMLEVAWWFNSFMDLRLRDDNQYLHCCQQEKMAEMMISGKFEKSMNGNLETTEVEIGTKETDTGNSYDARVREQQQVRDVLCAAEFCVDWDFV